MKINSIIQGKSARSLVLLAGVAAAGFLGVALIGQYGFDLHPCELCIAQRVPYALIILVSIIASFAVKSEQVMQKIALLCVLLFVIDGGIAIYHSGVELGMIKGPSGCTNNDKAGETIEEMRAALMNAQLVPCDQPMAYFFGLSMASWNALAALSSAILLFVMFRKSGKYSHG